MNGPYYVYVAGDWERVPGVQRGVAKTSARPSSETVSLGGVRRRQRAARAPRSWTLTFPYKDPRVVSWLTLAAQGMLGDVYLLDTAAAQVNMLDPAHTVGALSGSLIVVDGHTFPMVPDGHTFTIKCRAGVEYRLATTTNLDADDEVATIQVGEGTPIVFVAPEGAGAREASVLFTPDVDADVVFVFAADDPQGSSLLRLTEGSVDMEGFLPGQKAVCQVSVDDPTESLEVLSDSSLPLSTFSVMLVEVGL